MEGSPQPDREIEGPSQRDTYVARILDGAANEFYIFDAASLAFIEVNRGAQMNLGYSAEELRRMTPIDIKPEFTSEQFTTLMASLRSGAEPKLRFSTVHLRKDGTTYPVEVNLELARWGEREVFLAIILDITERLRAEKERFELALERERVTVLEDLISEITHDLKTPLAVIKTNIYLLQRQRDLSDVQQGKLAVLSDSARNLERLIEELLTLSRLDKTPPLKLAVADPGKLMRVIYENLSSLAETRQIEFRLETGDSVPEVFCNTDELHRAVVNIVENALNYTESGGSVTMRAYSDDTSVYLETYDTGVGIRESELPFVFDRFYRADKARPVDKGGTGLGLSIAKKVIEMHNGSIEVESVPEQGSIFRIKLPIYRG